MGSKAKIETIRRNKNMEPFISVIVPVFRVEQYSEGCVDSLLN